MARAPYRKRCEDYFGNETNRPFSILEACDAMGVDYETLKQWETGTNKELFTLARRVKARVAAGWEKGDVAPTVAVFLLKNYMGHSDKPGEGSAGPLELRITVEGDEL